MSGSFSTMRFDQVDLTDPFFDSLKQDYPEFNEWFARKSRDGASALVYSDEQGVGAFVYLKEENEVISIVGGEIPAQPRLKIGTLKVADRVHGERLGEGAIGLALWNWRDTGHDEVYLTVFEKHESLVRLLTKFGFTLAGETAKGESVYMKDRRQLRYGSAYESFPFLNPEFQAAYLLPIDDNYHDELFPYSELARQPHETYVSSAANGITKIYLGRASNIAARPGNPILAYRRHTGASGRGFKSVVTSYCSVSEVVYIKRQGRELIPYDEFRDRVKNKSVLSDDVIEEWYRDSDNLFLMELVYLGRFGAGHNVNWWWLKNHGCWPDDVYPHQLTYTPEQLSAILAAGGVDIATLVVD